MPSAPVAQGQPHTSSPSRLSPRDALLMAAWFGLAAGFLDLGGMVLLKHGIHASAVYKLGRFFPWTVPLANLAILTVPGLLVAAVNWVRPGLVSVRAAAWLLATLAIWGPLLDMHLNGTASLVLAAGLGRLISRGLAGIGARGRRWGRLSVAGLASLLVTIAMVTIGGQMWAEYRARTRLPAPPPGARNVLLIVMDTVRAESLSLYGYARDTTPQLTRWARRGVRFDWAMAPAAWTFPSHCSIFTGQSPYKLNSHWHLVLDTPYPTLAEFLASRGYLTAGFAANTSYCSYESGLDRGFVHYEDYPLSVWTILGSIAPGRWISTNVLSPVDYYRRKWLQFQSRDARGINRAFLDWLPQRRAGDRPFFAFLNYIDAHEPFIAPKEYSTRFGIHPESPRDYQVLLDNWDNDKTNFSPRDMALNRDAYDNCITSLDQQIGTLMDELDRRGELQDTLVIITSDHGEEFGEHKVFNHGYSLYLYETHVPLLIISAASPASRTVAEPVSLRDLPATVVDLLGLSADSPFPGRSLAAYWPTTSPADPASTTPALGEACLSTGAIDSRHARGPAQRGYTMSLVTKGWHYLRDGTGAEGLYDLVNDPRESLNVLRTSEQPSIMLSGFRKAILRVLTDDPVTIGAEEDYVKNYRRSLEALVRTRQPLDDARAAVP
jgi:arylsulfatase A-like enzyme